MTHIDNAGNPASGINDDADALYAQALHESFCFRADPVATIEQATARHPEFVMGWVMHAWLHALGTEPAAAQIVRDDVTQASRLAPNERERAHLAALTHFVDGRWPRAGRVLEDLSLAWPCDGLALQAGHFVDLYRGDSRMLRDRIARVFPHWSPADPDYHAVLGMLAFGREETGDYRGAEEAGKQALALEPRNAWAQHAVAHVYEMQGRAREGVAWMRERQPHWVDDNYLAVHNWWHLAMFHLDLGEHDAVFELFDGPIHGARSELVVDLDDASTLLWRLTLLGEDVSSRWHSVAQCWENAGVPGLNSFNDLHAMMAWIGTGRKSDAERWLAAQAEVTASDGAAQVGDHAEIVANVGEPLLRALFDHSEGRVDHAVEALRALRPNAHRIGGSHAQRDIIDLTLIDAALHAGQAMLARALIDERLMRKPGSAINKKLLARLSDADRHETEAHEVAFATA